MSKSRNQLAMEIQQGACNPYPVTSTLLDAIKDAGMGQQALEDPACRLIAHQLAHLFRVDELNHGPLLGYSSLTQHCETVELPPLPRPTTLREDTLRSIQALLSGKEWSPETLDQIAEVMRGAGYPIEEVED